MQRRLRLARPSGVLGDVGKFDGTGRRASRAGKDFVILELGQAVLGKHRSEVGLDELTRQMAGGDELTELSHELQH